MCDCCKYPYAYLQAGKLVITSRHGSQQHTNTFTPADLRVLAEELEQSQQSDGPKNKAMAQKTKAYIISRGILSHTGKDYTMSDESKAESPTESEIAAFNEPIDRDIFLEFLIGAVERAEGDESQPEEERHFDITLNVGGTLVSGTVISRDKFIAEEPFMKATVGIVEEGQTPEQKEVAQKSRESGRRHYIHLKNAVFFTGPGRPIPSKGEGVYWRGRLNRVDGWTVNRFTMAVSEEKS